jgi:hypothetical protein
VSQCCHVRDSAVYLPALLSRCITRDSVDPKVAVSGERFIFSLDISLDILKRVDLQIGDVVCCSRTAPA